MATPAENQYIAYCGLDCAKCSVYIATQENNDEKRQETAALWNKGLHLELKPEDINCRGCLVDKCLTERIGGNRTCLVHMCGKEKGVLNCAYCGEYICEKLKQLYKMFPETASDCRKTLDNIKKAIK